MFKVICVDASDRTENFASRLLVECNTYMASQCPDFNYCYELLEVMYDPNDGRPVSFKKDRFIPLSEINELELINEKQLVKY